MKKQMASRYRAFVKDLENIVNMDSGSYCPDGINRVADFFIKRFEKIGWRVIFHPFNDGKNPCIEVTNQGKEQGRNPEKAKTGKSKERFDFLFLGHMDTVFADNTVSKWPFSVQNSKAVGPGICDMKGGLVTILHLCEMMGHSDFINKLSICVGFNSDEEIGSHASRKWIEKLAKNSRRVFVFEPWRTTGQRVIKRKGGANYEIVCRGKASHAGAAPEQGINAVEELAYQIRRAKKKHAPEKGTTVCVTMIEGGVAANVIPDFAKAVVDVRFANNKEAGKIKKWFNGLHQKTRVPGVRVEVTGGINRLAMVPDKKTKQLWAEVKKIGNSMGMKMTTIATGGCSDGNFTAALGIPTIDAMGVRGGGVHSEDEYIELDGIIPNLQLMFEVMKAAGKGRLP